MKNIVVKQRGTTCGIYALLNGIKEMYSLSNFNSRKMHQFAEILLKRNTIEIEKPLEDGQTYIGEFFCIDQYIAFINLNKALIEEFVFKVLEKEISINVTKVPFSRIADEKDALFIASVLNTKLKNDGNVISHWISFKLQTNSENKFKVLNSNFRISKSKRLDELRQLHYNLADTSFYWNRFKRKNKTKEMNKYIWRRLQNKYLFIEKGLLTNKFNHQVGEVVMLKDQNTK
ncbi:hypothetical protein MKY91_20500 [Alkalicoccobacillus gibsonii]|uniref:Ubiquitinyl hydrolase 1 n=1 Tax=Alkalicoccobacillus gibsonii TaxID=79881 RepID=A0ABU9VNZ0_9BACI